MKITIFSVPEVPRAHTLHGQYGYDYSRWQLQETKEDKEYQDKSHFNSIITTMFNCKTSGKSCVYKRIVLQ